MGDLRERLQDGKPIFGTDGVRGEAGSELTPELAMAIGRAAGAHLRQGPVLVGRDTRRSGPMLSSALQAGLHASGIDTVDVGVLPSGGISFLTSATGANMGAIVSASHNPAGDNGIKLLSSRGTKLPEEVERSLEDRLRASGSSSALGQAIGFRMESPKAHDRYLDHVAASARYSFRGISIALDCANGAAYELAPELFDRLGADLEVHFADPDGTNINHGCGATSPAALAAAAQGRVGLAFDGDADRLIAVDEEGRVANGDVVMAVIARHMKEQGRLSRNVVVTTVMSNLGFRKSMEEAGIEVIETPVGDRYVMEELERCKGTLGGEQSGHVIFTDHARTGDGLLTAVQLLDVMAATGKSLSELRSGAIVEYPQVLHNVPMAASAEVDQAGELWDEVRQVESELGAEGRVLVRPSGTEPLLRIMVEAPGEDDAGRYAERIAKAAITSIGRG